MRSGSREGGGECWIERPPAPHYMNSAMIAAELRRLVEEGGGTRHSAQGLTLRVVLPELERARVPYTLTAVPGSGYSLTVPPPDARARYTGGGGGLVVAGPELTLEERGVLDHLLAAVLEAVRGDTGTMEAARRRLTALRRRIAGDDVGPPRESYE